MLQGSYVTRMQIKVANTPYYAPLLKDSDFFY